MWHIAGAAIWIGGAAALLLRQGWALALLVAWEFLNLTWYIEGPRRWDLFVLQVALLALLLSPSLDRHAPLPPRLLQNVPPPRRDDRTVGIVLAGLLIAAVIAGFSGSTGGIVLLTMAVFVVVVQRRALRLAEGAATPPRAGAPSRR